MNKLTKIGVSALCGSLASVAAANAGSLDVTGGATATYTSLQGVVTGNPLGMATSMTFTGNGELDNGSTFSVTIAHNNKSTYSSSAIALTTPSLGVFTYDEGGGTGLDRIDDMLPTAWEEVDGTGLGVGFRTAAGVGGGSDIEWNVGMGLPEGMNAYISYSPMPGGGQKNAFTIGYQETEIDNPGATGSTYDNDAYGISFAVNDDLSISFGHQESKTNVSGAATVDAQSLQLSYSVGGASVKVAETQVDNQNYVSGTNREGRTIAVTLAF